MLGVCEVGLEFTAWISVLSIYSYCQRTSDRSAEASRAKKKESIKCKIGKVTKLNGFIAEEAKTVKTSVVT